MTSTLPAGTENVAEIADEKARTAFLKKFAGDSRPSQPPSVPSSPPTGLTQLAQSRFPAGLLAQAEKRLADHIGAVAKVVVKRAAAKARDEGELYLLIADEISDPAERKAFIKKAISASGKPN